LYIVNSSLFCSSREAAHIILSHGGRIFNQFNEKCRKTDKYALIRHFSTYKKIIKNHPSYLEHFKTSVRKLHTRWIEEMLTLSR